VVIQAANRWHLDLNTEKVISLLPSQGNLTKIE